MPVQELATLTWEEVRALDKARTLAVLPVGAVEAHGPHLPLGTDLIIAEAMAWDGGERLVARGFHVLKLPSLAFTAAPFAAGFPGTISLRPETVTAVIVDLARSLSGQGIATLALANAHLDPSHIASLDAAVVACRELGLLRAIFPDITQRPWALRLTEEFRGGACHAGRYESSIVLAAWPGLVHDEVRRELPANPNSLTRAIREGKRSFEEAGGDRAYFGDPAAASRDEGVQTTQILGMILEEAVTAELATELGGTW